MYKAIALAIRRGNSFSVNLVDNRCPSQLCSAIASRQLSLMNVDANPCDDFYEYACGSLRKDKNLAEPDPVSLVNEQILKAMKKVKIENDTVAISHRFFKNFYQDCLVYENTVQYQERLKKAKEILTSVGSFRTKDHADSMALTDLVAKMLQHNSAPLFDILLDVSEAGRDAPFVIKIVPPTPRNSFLYPNSHFNSRNCFAQTQPPEDENLNLDNLYDSYAACKSNEENYMESLEEALRAFGAFGNDLVQVETLITNTKMAAEELLRSTLLSSAQVSEAEIRVDMITKGYEKHSIDDLQNQYSMLNWTDLLTKVVRTNSTLINNKTMIQVYSKNYFLGLFSQLDISSAEPSLYNAILSMFWHMLYTDFVAERGNCDRSNFCLHVAQRFMEDAASSLYLSAFDNATLANVNSKVKEIFNRETSLLTSRIRYSPVISDQTERDKLIEKLENMKIEISSQRKEPAEIYIAEENMGEDYFSKAIRLMKRRRERMYSDFREGRKPTGPAQVWSHFSLPTLTSANAVYGLNAIVIPQGLVASKYLPDAPEYINMGVLGTIMAHEIIHHFDSTGINYDADGKRTTAVTTQNEYIFQDLTTQLEQQFSFQKSLKLENGFFADFNINSELSINERFADVGAIDVAFEAFREWSKQEESSSRNMNLPYVNYNQTKSYFLAHAQMFCTKKTFLDYRVALYEGEHLPPKLRVDMIMRNSKYFLQTFACPPRRPKTIASLQDIL